MSAILIQAPLHLDIGASRRALVHFLKRGEVAIILSIYAHLGANARIFVCRLVAEGVCIGGSWALKVAHIDVPKGRLVDPGLLHLVGHHDADSLRRARIGVVVDH